MLWPSFTMGNGLDLGNLSRDPVRAEAVRSDPLFHTKISALLARELHGLVELVRPVAGRAHRLARADPPGHGGPVRGSESDRLGRRAA